MVVERQIQLLAKVSTRSLGIALSCNKSGEAPPAISGEKLSLAEMELRIKLLWEDSKLLKLHRELVTSGKLTESEFWATRKKLLD
ncbi:hypothetical protein QN277_012156 [Acacia crassicarpa]|uniref:BSD domain-containing protein n=1 Tax=Acacia crassicarpa TaxID=499986 RepID=A0AAE1N0B0_9FABA|nr:hypothetical protein QN277_012156 [Acacia crassicarpa]